MTTGRINQVNEEASYVKGRLHLKSNYSAEAVDDGKTFITTRERTTVFVERECRLSIPTVA